MRCLLREAAFAALVAPLMIPATALGVAPSSGTDAVARASASVVTVRTSSEQGSAFSYGVPGDFITSAHVLAGAHAVSIIAADGHELLGTVTRVDDHLDLAEVQAPLHLTPLRPSTAALTPGQPVYAIGTPLGLASSISNGVVSAVRPGSPHGADIQTDVPLNPGNSGGPLLDSNGMVVGVNEAKLERAAGVSFSIPVAEVAALQREPPLAPASASGGFPAIGVIASAVIGALILFGLGFTLGRARRARVAAITPAAVPHTSFEPDPRVSLKPKAAVEIRNHRK